MNTPPRIPKGTRDFGPVESRRREWIFSTIRRVFHDYGCQPLETPALELLTTLLGKYGEEGDKLLFKVLNSGDFLAEAGDLGALAGKPERAALRLCEKGLRYDLTVPFARYVVQHNAELTLPFKRYQMAPVWRADRPQKGRYREFTQCDVDCVGSNSLLCELELVQMVAEVFKRLGIRVQLRINNRKLLAGLAELIGAPERLTDITVAIDKLDKIGLQNVVAELRERGLEVEQIDALKPILLLAGSTTEKLDRLSEILTNEVGRQGVEELRTLFNLIARAGGVPGLGGEPLPVELDLTLARGLNYYTGAIFEVKALDVQIGSISGGGRYDDLTGIFGLPGLSGVGISFGADRIYDVCEQLALFPAAVESALDVLVVNFGDSDLDYALAVAAQLRAAGLATELYPDPAKMKKQLQYADRRGARFVLLCGENERNANQVTLKDMAKQQQTTLPLDQAIAAIQG